MSIASWRRRFWSPSTNWRTRSAAGDLRLLPLKHSSDEQLDLVDTYTPYIVGEHLRTRPRAVLDRLAKSPMLRERRIAIVATLGLVRYGEISDTFRIARKLSGDQEPLIHKAVQWLLREARRFFSGGCSRPCKNSAMMPRTTLRYVIERFPPEERKRMLKGIWPQGT